MKFAVSFIAPVAALRFADVHPTVNMVLTNDNSADANAFSLAEAKTIRSELADLIKESTHASLVENILRESVADGAAYEDGEIGLNLIPAGASAASLKSLFAKSDADFENEFHSGLHASLLQAIRIRYNAFVLRFRVFFII